MPYLDYDGLTRFKGKLDDTYKQKQTAKVDPVVDGVGTDFISNVTQDTNGAITATKKTVRTLIGATSNVNGSSGLAPAPSAGDTEKYLSGDGTWKNAPVSKPYAFELDMISVEAAGAYTRTTTGLPTTSTMKPINVECSNPDIFNDKIRVTVNNGSITISCDSMDVGTSYVTVTVMELGDAESAGTAIRTEEFDILASRINAKMDKASGAAPGKYLQINSSGTPVWGEAASPTAVAAATEAWLDENVSGGQTIAVDSSLSISGAAADAKVTGDLKSAFTQMLNNIDIDGYTESNELDGKSIATLKTSRIISGTGNPPYTAYSISANSAYRYYEIDVAPGEEFSVYSVNYNNIKSVYLVDSNDNLVSYYPQKQSSTETFVTSDFMIPNGVAKILVNEKVANPCTIKKRHISFAMTENMKQDMEKITENDVLLKNIEIDGYEKIANFNRLTEYNVTPNRSLSLNENDRTQYVISANSNFVYYTLNVVPGDIYTVKGWSNRNYKPAIIVDANDVVIAYYPVADDSTGTDKVVHFEIPANAVKMFVCGWKDHDNYCYRKEYLYKTSFINAIFTGLKAVDESVGLDMTWYANFIPDTVYRLNSGYNEIESADNSTYQTYQLAVNPGEKYKVKGISYNNYKTAILTNENNDLIKYYPIAKSSTSSVVESEFVIPEGCTKLLVVRNKTLDFYFKRVGLPIFDIDQRSSFYNPLYQKHLCTCGDSLTAAEQADRDTQTWMRKSYGWHVAYRNMMRYTNMGVSGETMCSTCLETGAYKYGFSETKYQNVPDDVDYITIFYGWNDAARGPMQYKDAYCVEHYGTHYGSCTAAQKAECEAAEDWVAMFVGTVSDNTCHTWYGGWNIVLGWLRENRPNAHIGVVLPYVETDIYRTTLIELCKMYGVSWVDGADPREWFSTGHSKGLSAEMVEYLEETYTADTLHPNGVGHERISYPYEQWVRGL